VSGRQVIDDQGHERVFERVAAVDVAKASGMVCVRLPHPSRPGVRQSHVQEVAATTGAVSALAGQLAAQRIEKVTLESTSDYWRIWFYLLEAAGLDVQLVSASQARQLSGRPKTDKCLWPGGHPGGMKCSVRPAGRGRRIQNGALRVRDKFGAGPAGPWIVASSTNPSFG